MAIKISNNGFKCVAFTFYNKSHFILWQTQLIFNWIKYMSLYFINKNSLNDKYEKRWSYFESINRAWWTVWPNANRLPRDVLNSHFFGLESKTCKWSTESIDINLLHFQRLLDIQRKPFLTRATLKLPNIESGKRNQLKCVNVCSVASDARTPNEQKNSIVQR